MIETRLEETRRRLLDLTRRNRLLNFGGRGHGKLTIVDELPEQVFKVLVTEGRTLQFLSLEEAPAGAQTQSEEAATPAASTNTTAALMIPPLPAAPIVAEAGPPERHRDLFLQTTVPGPELQTRLVHLEREARSALEEQGCNTLFLTLGMVKWRDQQDDGTVSRAPLLFVPVELTRRNVRSRHEVRMVDEDILVNPCLQELCTRMFRAELPALEIGEDFDLAAWLTQAAAAVEKLPGWKLSPEAHLGLFSFVKHAMYRDLDPESWPGSQKLVDHALIRLLTLGQGGQTLPFAGVPDAATLDGSLLPAETFQVVDADSSQQAAILAARQGSSLVIEGPPGTGKSQTITNLIAEFLAAGKTVLFVAEKAAALQVVEQRLERAGLGSFVLEMHSKKASKRAVLEELSRTLAEEEASGKSRAEAGELLRLRQELNDYVKALHSPVMALATSPFQGMARAVALRHAPVVDCELQDPLTTTPEELRQATEAVDVLDRRLVRVGDPVSHPWRGARLNRVAVDTEQKVLASAAAFAEAIATARRHAAALTATLGAPAAATPADLERLRAGAQAVLAAPVADPRDPRWSPPAPALVEWLKEGQARAQKVAEWNRFFQTSAEVVDWTALITRREARKDSMFRFLSGEWRGDSRTIQAQLLPGTRLAVDEQLRLLGVLGESLKLRKRLEIGATHFGPMFGAAWREMDSDFAELARRLEAVGAVRRRALSGEMQLEAVAAQLALEDRAALRQQLVQLEQCLPGLESAAKAWLAMIASGEQDWFACPWSQRPLADEEQRLRGLPAVIEKLSDWADCNASADQARATRAAPLVELAFVQAGAAIRGHLARAFERQFWRLWADRVIASTDALRTFRGEDQEARIGRFRQADVQWLEQSRTRLAELVRSRRPDVTGDAHRESKLGVLKAEMRKKRRHMPLRKLFAIAGDVVQGIKPCFMMSPLSVASFLEPGGLRFDVVIFDEASQVEPADAYGAIARAGQALLIGDEKQLPPTSFFQKIEQDDNVPAHDDVAPTDLESILSLAITRFPRRSQCSLRWHYRSRHQSLIEFSNRAFYDHALRVFPSPHHSREELGLLFRHVPEGVYLRGEGQFNPVEARTVAEAVLEHAATSPGLSLGVGAFSVQQQRAIQDEVERLRREQKDDRVEEFFDPGREEPFFVKNLETIQGDERDVIFLSVCYGRDKTGKITMNFGPLNQDGGWRRLNVLVTRSRRRCVLFSSVQSEDLDLGDKAPRGVVALKDYLYTAEHGRPPASQLVRGASESPLEESIARALEEKGHTVHAHVGCAGFSIDIAVLDPARPGRYLLGVECDGATYQGSPTARDRDRLRDQILRGLGWEIVRVWSTDWFRQPDRVLAKILATIAEIQRRPVTAPKVAPAPRPAAPAAPVKPPATAPVAPPPAPAPGRTARGKPEAPEPTAVIPPYQRTPERSLGSVDHLIASPPEKLAVQIEEIVRIEGPIHEEEVLRVLVGQYGARATARPKVAFAAGLLAAKAAGKVLDKGEFLWPPGMATPPVRERSSEDAPTRPELIAPEEFEAAVLLVVAREFGLKRDALAARTIKFLGFARGGQKLSAAADAAIGRLLERKALTEDGQGFLVET